MPGAYYPQHQTLGHWEGGGFQQPQWNAHTAGQPGYSQPNPATQFAVGAAYVGPHTVASGPSGDYSNPTRRGVTRK